MKTSLLDIERTLAVWLAVCLVSVPSNADPRITEFMAINGSGILDQDGGYEDWIEIENPDASQISLNGWYLTDDPDRLTKWKFPDITVAPRRFLVVFASNKDRTDPNSELHTNFTLSGDTEFIALVEPDGTTIASSFVELPPQFKNLSFGVGAIGGNEVSKPVAKGTPARYLVPTEDPGTDWRLPGFDDSAWPTGNLAFGYDNRGPYVQLLGENGDLRAAVQTVSASVYVRSTIEIPDPGKVVRMVLSLNWDDGVVGFLNGNQILAENAPDPLEWNSRATDQHSDDEAIIPSTYDIDFADKLVPGTNILAFHLMNHSPGGSDLLLLPELHVEKKQSAEDEAQGFFEFPSPGTPNGAGKLPPAYVEISVPTKAFATGSVEVEITTETEGAAIRYTTDGSEPIDDFLDGSPIYHGPLSFDSNALLRARAFLPRALAGPIRTEAYFKLEADAAAFTSTLPIVLVDTFGTRAVANDGTDRTPTMMALFEPKGESNPRSSMLNPPDLVTRAGVRKSGLTIDDVPKYEMWIEAWTENDWEEKNIAPLGFDADADWLLDSFYRSDRALIRAPFIFEVSRRMGRYAPRTKHVEVYHNKNGEIGGPDYFGVYTFGEIPKQGKGRIDVEALDRTHSEAPEITGGYILKKGGFERGGIDVRGMGKFVQEYPPGSRHPSRPDEPIITKAQSDWLLDHLAEINEALSEDDGIHRETGLHISDYIDVDSFIDHIILNTLAMNPNWGSLESWLHLPRGGKLQGGPIWWGFNVSMGSDASGGSDPDRVWYEPGGSSQTWFDVGHPYFGQVMGYTQIHSTGPPRQQSDRPDHLQRLIDRWFELRRGPLSSSNLLELIDELAAPLSQVQERNFARWNKFLPNGGEYANGDEEWQGEITHMKGWIRRRAEWIDDQFPDLPRFNQAGGVVSDGFGLVMTYGEGQLFYTTDGSDPRAPGGAISSAAKELSGVANDSRLVSKNSSAKYYVPSDGSLGKAWTAVDFDDSAWTEAGTGIGWETQESALSDLIVTDIEDELRGVNSGAYLRWNFEINDAAAVNGMTLTVHSDDGFVAYINGVRVAALNAPDQVLWNSKATTANPDADVVAGLSVDASMNKAALRDGNNVLAIHAMNQGLQGSDFLISAALDINERLFPDPLELRENQTITARVLHRTFWGAPVSHGFVIGTTFTGDPDADEDSDGLNAFAEYALGTVDTSSSSGPGAVQVSVESGNLLHLSYTKNVAAGDVAFTVELSTDLIDWGTEGVRFVSEKPVGDGKSRVIFQSDLTSPSGPELFMRLRMAQKPDHVP